LIVSEIRYSSGHVKTWIRQIFSCRTGILAGISAWLFLLIVSTGCERHPEIDISVGDGRPWDDLAPYDEVIQSKINRNEIRFRHITAESNIYRNYDKEVEEAVRRALPERPRVLIDEAGWERLRNRVKTEPSTARIYEHFRSVADDLLERERLERGEVVKRMRDGSEALHRILTSGIAWMIGGDQRYLEHIRITLLDVTDDRRYPDWNPPHFLDVAQMSLAVSIGYDWIYNELTGEERDQIRTALVEKAIQPGLKTRFTYKANNWGQVVCGGLTAAAVSVLDEEPELATRLLKKTVRDVRVAAGTLIAPDGNYPEGAGYWNFGMTYQIIMTDVLRTAFGEDFGLSKEPGFESSGEYMLHVTGPNLLTFSHEFERRLQGLIWYAKNKGTPMLPEWSHEARFIRGEGLDAWNQVYHGFAFLWLPDEELHWQNTGENGRRKESSEHRNNAADKKVEDMLPLDWFGRGPYQVAMHRSSWSDPEALYVGIKARNTDYNKANMDAGDFVVDAGGVRWAIDRVPRYNYSIHEELGMSLWSFEPNSDRWKIFKHNNFSHNTLVIDGQYQTALVGNDGARIVEQSVNGEFPLTIVDLTGAYRGQAGQIHRMIGIPERQAVLVMDEIDGLEPGTEVRWAMGTQAEVSEDGHIVTLKKDDRTMKLEISGDTSADRWDIIDLAEPPAEWDKPLPGGSLLTFYAIAPDDGNLNLRVRMTPDTADPSPNTEWWENAEARMLETFQSIVTASDR